MPNRVQVSGSPDRPRGILYQGKFGVEIVDDCRVNSFPQVERVMDLMKASQPAHGMWPTYFDVNNGMPMNGEPELTDAMS